MAEDPVRRGAFPGLGVSVAGKFLTDAGGMEYIGTMRYSFLLLMSMMCGLVSCIGSKNFTVHTYPEGATVNINGKRQEGVTPMTVRIKQDKDLGIVVRKPGYQSTAETVHTKTSAFQSLLWTSHDPRAQYIEEDEITIPLTPVAKPANFRPTRIPVYNNPNKPAPAKAPTLREMPTGI